MSLFGSLEIGKSSLLAHQNAIDVVSHNMANLNTKGYTRQRAELETSYPLVLQDKHLGQGVDVAGIKRLVNEFLNTQLIRENSELSYYEQKEELLNQMEAIFNEFQGASVGEVSGPPEDSFTGMLNKFWSIWQDVADNPQSASNRASLVVQAGVVCQTLNQIASDLTKLEKSINDYLPSNITEINNITSEIASLNKQILFPEMAGLDPNDLKDRRDLLVSQLSEYMDVTTFTKTDGTMNVMVAGDTVVQGQYSKTMVLTQNDNASANYTIQWSDTGLPVPVEGGKLGAFFEIRDIAIPEVLDQLNTFAMTLVNEVNAIHRTGMGLDGSQKVKGVYEFNGTLDTNATFQINNTTITLAAGDNLTAIRDKINLLTGTHGVQASIEDNRLVLQPVDTNYNVNITDDPNEVMLDLGIISNFFAPVTDPSQAALLIAVDQTIQTDHLKIAASSDGTPGGNAIANAISGLQNAFTMDEDSITFSNYYGRIVTELGSKTAEAHQLHSNQDVLYRKIERQRDSQSGVNLDDELTDMVRFQKGYQTAAKIITTIDEMISVVLGLKR